MINKSIKIGLVFLAVALLLLTVVALAANGSNDKNAVSGDPWDDKPADENSYSKDGDPWQDEDPWDENKVIEPIDVHCAAVDTATKMEHPWDDDE